MAGTMVKRSQMAHFLNVEPKESTPTWARFAEGHESLSTSYNPETETTQYIHQDTGTTYLKNYALSIDTTQIAHKGDAIFDFVDDLSFRLAVAGDSITDYLEVRIYNATGSDLTAIPARLFKVAVSVTSEGDAATDPLSREYTLSAQGDPVPGTFNIDTLTFTPAA